MVQDAKKFYFLIVDANEAYRAAFKKMLKGALDIPFKIIEASNEIEAIRVLHEKSIDCIILDINLPGSSGSDLLKTLKNSVQDSAPIIILTAYGNKNAAENALQAGAKQYLIKSEISAPQLAKVILSAIQKQSLESHNISNVIRWLLYSSGLVIMLLASMVLYGWYSHSTLLVQVLPGFPPVQYNTALTFMLLGAGILFLHKLPRVSLWLAPLAFLLSSITLLQYIFSTNFGIDMLFMKPFTVAHSSHPGRMSPNTALCFMLGSSALFFNAENILFRYQQILAVIFSSFILMLGAIALVGYMANIPTAYNWGMLTGMNIITASCMTIVGVGLLAFSLRAISKDVLSVKFIPLLIALLGSVFFLLLWQALAAEEDRKLSLKTSYDANQIKDKITDRITGFNTSLLHMQKRVEFQKPISIPRWEYDAKLYLDNNKVYDAIALVSKQNNTDWHVVNNDASHSAENLSIMKKCLDQALAAHQNNDFYIGIPDENALANICLVRYSTEDNLIELINIHNLMSDRLLSANEKYYQASLTNNKQTLEIQHGIGQVLSSNWISAVPLTIIDKNLELKLWPTDKFLQIYGIFFPSFLLAFGMAITLLLALAQYLWIKARQEREHLVSAIKKQEILEMRFQAITVSAKDAIIMMDSDDRIVFWNPAASEIFGYTMQEVIGNFIYDLIIPPRFIESYKNDFNHTKQTREGPFIGKTIEITAIKNSGQEFPMEISITTVRMQNKLEAIAIVRDITERKNAESIIKHQANYDILTDLPNRLLFAELLKNALIQADKLNLSVSLMSIDLDGFKPVNDLYGHEAGDELLRQVSKRLLKCVGESNFVARVGGDEFAVILVNLRYKKEAAMVATLILSALVRPFHIYEHLITIGGSIGIVNYPQDATFQKDLIIKADDAMYTAKKSGKSKFCFFN
jgi:diguanylate cyclase (GGDEF)-like protein/PAS domain S-box-containing protein